MIMSISISPSHIYPHMFFNTHFSQFHILLVIDKLLCPVSAPYIGMDLRTFTWPWETHQWPHLQHRITYLLSATTYWLRNRTWRSLTPFLLGFWWTWSSEFSCKTVIGLCMQHLCHVQMTSFYSTPLILWLLDYFCPCFCNVSQVLMMLGWI